MSSNMNYNCLYKDNLPKGDVCTSKNDYMLATRTLTLKGYRKRKRGLLANILILIGILGIIGGGTAAVIYYLL